jgi:hypothetical protein
VASSTADIEPAVAVVAGMDTRQCYSGTKVGKSASIERLAREAPLELVVDSVYRMGCTILIYLSVAGQNSASAAVAEQETLVDARKIFQQIVVGAVLQSACRTDCLTSPVASVESCRLL